MIRLCPLYALNARLVLIQSLERERVIALKDFYTGVRKHVLQPDELVTAVLIPKMALDQKGVFEVGFAQSPGYFPWYHGRCVDSRWGSDQRGDDHPWGCRTYHHSC